MTKSSICFILPSAYGYFNTDISAVGGGARQLSLISQELVDMFDVHFVVGDYGQPQREVYNGVTLHRSYAPSQTTPAWKKPVQFAQLFNAMRRAHADVYVYRGRPLLASITYVIARFLGSNWCYNLANDSNIEREPSELYYPVRLLFKHALFDADLIITQTAVQKDKLKHIYNLSSTVIPSGYPLPESTNPHKDREYFLWVGRLDPEQKRPHIFLNLAKKIPKASFYLVGPTGSDKMYNEELQSRMDKISNLEYIGPVHPSDIHTYYQNAIALVNTSAYEGFPSTFLEAWRYETPVITLDIPITRYVDLESYKGDANGDFKKLLAIAKRLYRSSSFRMSLSEPTKEYFQNNLTIKKVANRYGSELDSIVD